MRMSPSFREPRHANNIFKYFEWTGTFESLAVHTGSGPGLHTFNVEPQEDGVLPNVTSHALGSVATAFTRMSFYVHYTKAPLFTESNCGYNLT